MSLNIGLNVIEVEGPAAPGIQAAPTSVGAFLICAPTGEPGQVRRVTNWTEFVSEFGERTDGACGAYAVRGFFDNGGSLAYVVRLQPNTAAASVTLSGSENTKKLEVCAGYRGKEIGGAWGNGLEVKIAASGSGPTYSLIVRLNGRDVETWSNLNQAAGADAIDQQKAKDAINDIATGSRYIMVKSEGTANPDATDPEPLTGGTNDEAQIAAAAKGALALFDTYDVQLVCCPETSAEAWAKAALTYCELRGDCMFVGHTPQPAAKKTWVQMAEEYGKKLQGSSYGALYFPWIQIADLRGQPLLIPPTGHVLGVYARTERERGIWKAPAGNAARVRGALDVAQHITDTTHTALVKGSSVNAIRFISGQGIIIDSSRTLSTDTRMLYVNIRLLFNFVKSSLKGGLRWVVQEPNDQGLWNKVKYNTIVPFLMGLWRRGAFGAGAPEDLFTVKIDEENNPPDQIQQGILTIWVYFYPSRPAETVVVYVGQQEAGATAGES